MNKDLANDFLGGSSFAHFGFTSGTGAGTNLQQVRLTDVSAVFEPGSHSHTSVAPPVLSLSGNAAYDHNSVTVTLTPDATWKNGGVMSEERIDVTYDFTITIDVFLGSKDKGADGLSFILHDDPRGKAALGAIGGGMGAAGIQNGLAIEFDTWNNVAVGGDMPADHTGFHLDTDAIGNARLVTPALNLGNIEDGKWHNAKITWDASSHTLSYTFDGRPAGSLTAQIDEDYFRNSQFVHFGATAATGGSSNLHMVRFVSVDAVFEGSTDTGHTHTAGITAFDQV